MIKVILFLVLWMVAVGLLLLFGNDVGTFVVLVGSLAFVGLSATMLAVAPKANFRVDLVLPDTCAKDEDIAGTLMLSRRWWGAVFGMYCTLTCENTLTGEVEVLDFNGNRLKTTTPLTLQTSHCGALRVRVDNLLVLDPIGLFSRTVKRAVTHHVVVPPVGSAVQLPTPSSAADMDSDTYSTSKAGMDVSETYAIREYQPGDPIRSIHWKLTEKLDKVMVREFGLPIDSTVLLALDTSTWAQAQPAGRDASAALFLSAALALVSKGTSVTLGWPQQDGGFAACETRTVDEVLTAIQTCLLTLDVKNTAPIPHGPYEKMLAVTISDIPKITIVGGLSC